jgi:hypothetical protein
MPHNRADFFLGALALGVPILVGGAAQAASVTVDFNARADGTPFVAPTRFVDTVPLTEELAALGVRFVGGGGVLSGSFGVSGASGPNYLVFNARSTARYANGAAAAPPEQVRFDRPANLVRLRVGSAEGGTATLRAFDASGNVVGTAQVALTPTAKPVEVQSPAYNVAAVELTVTGARTVVADDLVFVVQDETNLPPVTECALDGRAGANGWFLGDVRDTLTARDPDGTVAATRCRVDGGEWQPYSEPVVVTGEGTHAFEYQSLDEDGAWEDVQAESVKIDTAPPAVDLRLSRLLLWPPNGKMLPVVVNGSTADTGSQGVKVVFEVKDEYGEVQPALSAFGETIRLQASVRPKDCNGRLYRVTATATDEAGQTNSVSRFVLVPRSWCPPHKEAAAVKQGVKAKEAEKLNKPAPKKPEPKNDEKAKGSVKKKG